VDSIPRLVQNAVRHIDAGYLNDQSVEDLARSLGVTSRHLRRAMESQLGVSPAELAQSRRLALAKQLLHDTTLPLAQIAFASGFGSVRRFNTAFLERFGRNPSTLRRDCTPALPAEGLALRLDYRPPFDWPALLSFLRFRAIPGVETVTGSEYARTVRIGAHSGGLTVSQVPDHASLLAVVSLSLAPKLMEIAARLRAFFDLDSHPGAVAEHLGRDPLLAALLQAHPGLRVPGAFDGFELALRAVLGQQVSVQAATTLSGRLVEKFGTEVPEGGRAFPAPEALTDSPLERIRAIGLTERRARTLQEVARAVSEGRVDLSGQSEPQTVMRALLEIPGIGPWTAQYIAMRALRWPDAFPSGDLALRKAMETPSSRAAEERAEAWRPWRSYAVLHLWTSLSQGD
jgi:AraC family transcriptional regulator of adaptative response / DNA-3-methyladenine glycosylase II